MYLLIQISPKAVQCVLWEAAAPCERDPVCSRLPVQRAAPRWCTLLLSLRVPGSLCSCLPAVQLGWGRGEVCNEN